MATFDCSKLDERLEAILDGRLDGAWSRAAEAHLLACSRCRSLVEAARSVVSVPSGLVDAVLTATSGPACALAEERLGDLVDGRLDGLDEATLSEHLTACAPCESLRRVMVRLSRDLPSLAEIDPGPGFVEDVLSRSGPRPDRVSAWAATWMDGWRRLWWRPRFAFEAAYVLTLVVLLVFGVPDSRVAAASRRVADLAPTTLPYHVERSVDRLGSSVASGVQDVWDATRGRVAEDAAPAIAEVESAASTKFAELQVKMGTLWSRIASAVTKEDEGRSDRDGDRENGDEP